MRRLASHIHSRIAARLMARVLSRVVLALSLVMALLVILGQAPSNVRIQAPDPVEGGADADFESRCTASGVVTCIGFDTHSGTVPTCDSLGGWPDIDEECANTNAQENMKYSFDSTVYASGDGGSNHKSMKLDFDTSVSGEDVTGDYVIGFGDTFGPNEHWYAQFALRLDGLVSDGGTTLASVGGQGWKTAVFAPLGGPFAGDAEIALVTFQYGASAPQRAYVDVSGDRHDNFELDLGAPEFSIQHCAAGTDIICDTDNDWCQYNGLSPNPTCVLYIGGEWGWYYLDVLCGTGGTNCTIKIYFCRENDSTPGWRQWIHATNYTIDNWGEHGGNGFGTVGLTGYTTGRGSGGSGVHTLRYDEVIVSTLPIALPSRCAS
jgi:hypothetical protein